MANFSLNADLGNLRAFSVPGVMADKTLFLIPFAATAWLMNGLSL